MRVRLLRGYFFKIAINKNGETEIKGIQDILVIYKAYQIYLKHRVMNGHKEDQEYNIVLFF
ncbi:hypothetical protein CD32_22445 [Lysinibacillus odysseyi 34hs-1 = NBRC 100172]|uniref:Uncharacterized protein n=1 Tax=Lysinibacillus odysseyi 34hs-1 = NBRC 100172 TaxID=1220589 RepID=A0A0A3IBA9_9BACI|nr:hypothetical protein CD32_22445 [Lysinibacillus odysseyi 34hs-1 = NBRC 100172]